MQFALSPLYPILDAAFLPSAPAARERYLVQAAAALAQAGVTMLQYRNKRDDDADVLRDALRLRAAAPPSLRILLNDRVQLVRASGCDGVHIGQKDGTPEHARMLIGPHRILGLSTHTGAQIQSGDLTTADYLAIGPVYPTGSKPDAESPIGLEGIRRARLLTHKPLVAIGGITLAHAREVRTAGADSLAVISALFAPAGTDLTLPNLQKLAKDFLHIFR